MMRHLRGYLLLLPAVTLLAVAACSSGGAATTPTAGSSQDILDRISGNAHSWEVIGNQIDAVLATPDLGTGPQRFALVLSDDTGLVRLPVVEMSSYRYPDGPGGEREGPVESKLAHFSEFPLGTRGIHVTDFNFDRAGTWSVEAKIPQPDGSSATVEVRFPVKERPMSVAVGDKAPPSKNRTLADVDSISQLTTGSLHDNELYRYTVAEEIDRQRPFVVVFASPAFCTNAVCGPQVEVASDLRQEYGDRVDFIHVDLFENPDEIQGDLNKAVETPLLDEWGLLSPEWTFVMAPGGTVTARFENFVSEDELSAAIQEVLAAG